GPRRSTVSSRSSPSSTKARRSAGLTPGGRPRPNTGPAPLPPRHRRRGGLTRALLWYEDSTRVAVHVVDTQTGGELDLEVAGPDAMDAFQHPYAYRLLAAATASTRRPPRAR